MRTVWVSFDTIGRECLLAAVQVGADVAAIVTLVGPVDPFRSGQCTFDEVATAVGAELIEVESVNAPDTVHAVAAVEPDAVFVVGWSELVCAQLIEVPLHGIFGMHPTLLPKHRGRAPIPWTILAGLARTGVTLFEITDQTADSGPIVGQAEVEVAPDETATTLMVKITDAHVALIRKYVPMLAEGIAPRIPQDGSRASIWPRRTPDQGIIDWETRASYLDVWVRAQTRPYPGAFTYVGVDRLIIWRASTMPWRGAEPPGTVVADGPIVACGEGALLLEEFEGPTPLVIGARLG